MGTNGDVRQDRPAPCSWPTRPLTAVPASGAETEEVARRIRRAIFGVTEWTEPITDLRVLCAAASCRLKAAPLRAVDGGIEALLLPREDHFELVVDATPLRGWGLVPANLRADLERHRLRFRVAHELAHTLFFSREREAASTCAQQRRARAVLR